MAQYILFADTNVFLDAFLQRDLGIDCKKILYLSELATLKLYTSSSCLLTVIYFLQKSGIPQNVIIETMKDLFSFVSLQSTDKQAFLSGLSSGFSDLEDAIQYQTALEIKGIDYFITSNIKDFKKALSTLQVLTPSQFLKLINEN